ncbi:MAG: formylglycine-generating enzyme family protein [Deltaproteobacteria bacterium]|nr:formylglycine-generating enzyme family protein [Deltaproteobacteria bacterium]
MLIVVAGCGSAPPVSHPDTAKAPLSYASDDGMVVIAAGRYVAGSTPEERQVAYDDYLHTANHDGARENEWFGKEQDRHIEKLPAFSIDLLPVTQAAFAEFVATGAAPAPTIDEAAWKAQGFQQDYATQVARFVWKDNRPPIGREDHPVVLVTHTEATRYCAWRNHRRLPTAAEYEKAARGEQGLVYPWGNVYEASKLNSAVAGPGDTVPAGTYNDGASPYGILDLAGNVFQWTSTPGEAGKLLVKGSAWDDHAGVGRGASSHGRKREVRHVIVGFRCAADAK